MSSFSQTVDGKTSTLTIRLGTLSQLALGLSIIFFLSRGAVELFSSKTVGYAINLTGIILLCSCILYRPLGFDRKSIVSAVSFYIFFCCIIISGILSLFSGTYSTAVAAQVAISFIAITPMFLSATIRPRFFDFSTIIIVISIILIFCFFIEYFDLIDFPSSKDIWGITRLSGPTGSYQHWSFTLASFSLLNLYIYKNSSDKIIHLIIAASFAICCITSGTRNGIPVIICGWALFALCLQGRSFIMIAMASPFILFALSLLLDPIYLERALSIFSMQDRSNEVRIGAWIEGVGIVMSETGFLGANVGLYSQVGDRLGIVNSQHLESGLLVIALNYGILGLTSYIGLIIAIGLQLRPFARMMLYTLFVPQLYYPGTESVPFFMLTALFVLVARQYERQHRSLQESLS